jgi:hypothetical protein
MIFNEMVEFMKSLGYEVFVEDCKSFLGATSKDKQDLWFGFCESNNGQSNPNLNGKIAIDRNDCFDKWSKCPINLPFPENDKQKQFLIDKINWLKTDEGYKASNEYEFEKWVADYPEEMRE